MKVARVAAEAGGETGPPAGEGRAPLPDPLSCAEALARACAEAAWFAALGEPPTAAETHQADLYARALGAREPQVSWLRDPSAVEALLARSDHGDRWWEREEAVRRHLAARAAGRVGKAALDAGIERLVPWMLAPLEGAAARALLRLGSSDAALAKVAAGAAAITIQQEYLRRLAGAAGGHGFAEKFRLFLAGRWPLLLAGERLWIF
ncbi:MAG: hypothetical protein D6740_13470 [Alphaproteobacteria bacterium]|nr:MAG: hypothetical protein D6740_13470 [Alphaproteobacteria bacterium]